MKTFVALLAVALVALLFCNGCAKRQLIQDEAPPVVEEAPEGFALGQDVLPATTPEPEPFVEPAPAQISVWFDFDSYELRPETCLELDQFAGTIADRMVTVYGACCVWGTDDYNFDLGERRARAVREYLARQGVPRGCIITESWGETHLVTTDMSRQSLNRRCEVVIN